MVLMVALSLFLVLELALALLRDTQPNNSVLMQLLYDITTGQSMLALVTASTRDSGGARDSASTKASGTCSAKIGNSLKYYFGLLGVFN